MRLLGGIASAATSLGLTSEYITLSRRALSSSETAGGWSPGAGGPGDERPALDGGASPTMGSAVGSCRGVSDMMSSRGVKRKKRVGRYYYR